MRIAQRIWVTNVGPNTMRLLHSINSIDGLFEGNSSVMGLFDGTALERPVVCELCGQDTKVCKCTPQDVEASQPDTLPARQLLKVRVDKRKRGKLITVVAGFSCKPPKLKAVLTQLKNHLGAGGTIEADTLEIQGDHVARATTELPRLGYRIAGKR